MKTFQRLCIKDCVHPKEGILLKKGDTYLTSRTKDNECTVFTRFWFKVPTKEYFTGKLEYTKK